MILESDSADTKYGFFLVCALVAQGKLFDIASW